ncbi:hypothetical protein A5766_02680 [Gordonia sp. 852002-51296_SCH5728562-b]|nr:hypothetical protein A5766_02680 [Gordonia sp. 852002-51296_SCH5728562-b]
MLVYRGVRSAPKVFGLDTSALSDLIGQTVPLSGYFATSVHRAVAANEFTRPPSSPGPALLELEVPAGTPALWIPPLGDGALAYQGELLLSSYVVLQILGVDEAGSLPTIRAVIVTH